MKARKYTIADLWDDLEKDYKTFKEFNRLQATNPDDEESYNFCESTIGHLIKLGRETEQISIRHPKLKANSALTARSLYRDTFGETGVPPIKGVLSLAFVKKVILPLLNNSSKIEHEWWLLILCTFIPVNLSADTRLAKEMAVRCDASVKANELLYQTALPLVDKGVFTSKEIEENANTSKANPSPPTYPMCSTT